jgi:hypothetical protein
VGFVSARIATQALLDMWVLEEDCFDIAALPNNPLAEIRAERAK